MDAGLRLTVEEGQEKTRVLGWFPGEKGRPGAQRRVGLWCVWGVQDLVALQFGGGEGRATIFGQASLCRAWGSPEEKVHEALDKHSRLINPAHR